MDDDAGGLFSVNGATDPTTSAAADSGPDATIPPPDQPEYALLPAFDIGRMATRLASGDNGYTRLFNMSDTGVNAKNHTLQYTYSGFSNLTINGNGPTTATDTDGLTAPRRILVDEAFKYLGAVMGITFTQTADSTPGDVDFFFYDNSADYGAFASYVGNPSPDPNVYYKNYAYINIDPGWHGGESTIGDYSFSTVIHEILHGMGLYHAGNYNQTATFVTDDTSPNYPSSSNIALNDSHQLSIMSYMFPSTVDASGNPYWNSTVFATNVDQITPMAADIEALRILYGPTSAFLLDTIYGEGTNIAATTSAPMHNLAALASGASFNIVDDGGIDTVNFSNTFANQRIDLRVVTLNDVQTQVSFTSNIYGLIGNMALSVGTLIENAYSGGGNDFIIGNSAWNKFYGGAGNDTLEGRDGDDLLVGGAGADTLYGGDGSDTASYETATTDVAAYLNDPASNQGDAAGDSYFEIENLTGSDHDDYLGGDDNPNQLIGGAGSDILWGMGGNDQLFGGSGADVFYGGGGIDTAIYVTEAFDADLAIRSFYLRLDNGGSSTGDWFHSVENFLGSQGSDYLGGDAGANRIEGSFGNDTIDGDDGADQLYGGNDDDLIYGGSDDASDTLFGGYGNDTLAGMGGNDVLYGDVGNDWFYGDDGADTIFGGIGIDTLDYSMFSSAAVQVGLSYPLGYGGAAEGDSFSSIENLIGSNYDDVLAGTVGDNWISGAGGNDTILGFDGNNWLRGGAGTDLVDYTWSVNAVAADLVYGNASITGVMFDLLESIENLRGTSGNDSLSGDGGNNRLSGEGGDDLIVGRGGADSLYGGLGTDSTAFLFSTAGVLVNLAGGFGQYGDAAGDLYDSIENVTGSDHGDTLIGTDGVNRLIGGAGHDLIEGGAAGDWLEGGQGDDTLSYAGSAAGVSVDLASTSVSGGDAAGDTISGFENLTGSAQNDTLAGTDGVNRILAGAGDDWVEATAGADYLDGGTGIDTLSYRNSTGPVTIFRAPAFNSGGYAIDTILNFENFVGSAFADYMSGDAGANALSGLAGSDTLWAMGDNDSLYGGTGNDQLILDNYSNETHGSFSGGKGVDSLWIRQTSNAGPVDLRQFSLTGLEYFLFSISNTPSLPQNLDMLLMAEQLFGWDEFRLLLPTGFTTHLTIALGSASTLLLHMANLVGLGAGDGSHITGDGDAEMISGTYTADLIEAAGGNDTIYGQSGNDSLYGGDDDDLIEGDEGADLLSGGDGVDTLSYANSFDGVTVNLASNSASGGDAQGDSFSGFENLTGSGADDHLTGTIGSNVIDAGAGNDTVIATGGTDRLNGGDGIDLLDFSGWGHAVSVNLFQQVATVEGTTIQGIRNFEQVTGTAQDDLIVGSNGDDWLEGGAGNDTLDGLDGSDTIYGGTGNDQINIAPLAAPNLTADGGTGSDLLFARRSFQASYELDLRSASLTSVERLALENFANEGSARARIFLTGIQFAGLTDISIPVGADRGVILQVTLGDVTSLDLRTPTLTGFDGPLGLIHALGDADAETITGTNGLDLIEAGAGNDQIAGLAGADTLYGGADIDTLDYSASDAGVTVDLTGNTASGGHAEGDVIANFENLIGSDHDDHLTGTNGNNRIYGGAGNDLIESRGGDDDLDGGDGIDTLSFAGMVYGVSFDFGTDFGSHGDGTAGFENLVGSDHDDDLTGDALTRQISGGAGNDRITVTAEGEVIYGGAGEDYILLSGSMTQATLDGGADIDVLQLLQDSSLPFVIDLRAMTISSIEQIAFFGDGHNLAPGTAEIRLMASLAAGLAAISFGQRENIGMTVQIDMGTRDALDLRGLISNPEAGDSFRILGDDTAELIHGFDFSTIVELGGGNDTVFGQAEDDSLYGGAGDDLLDGGLGRNRIEGGSGLDRIIGRFGGQVFDGGENADTVDYTAAPLAVVVDLTSGRTSGLYFGDDTLVSIENAIGTAHEDVLIGDAADNGLFGGAGNDVLSGGAGRNTLEGGAGEDLVSYASLGSAISAFQNGLVSHSAGNDRITGVETVIGTDYDDLLQAAAGVTRLVGGMGADVMVAYDDHTSLFGGSDNDTLLLQSSAFFSGIFDGGDGFDVLGIHRASDVVDRSICAQRP